MPEKDKLGTLSTVLFTILALLAGRSAASAADTRSDSFDIQHYTLHLDVTDFTNKRLQGACFIELHSKVNGLDRITLDLYRLQVDSVKMDNNDLSYTYNDSIINIQLGKTIASGASAGLWVYYSGKPKLDPGGWGGFYWSESNGGVAFNLGVGFTVNPHNFGRAWFPCVDNFVDRATFEFYITTKNDHKAFCNGLLKDSTLNVSNEWVWHWELGQDIPTYLASVAVGNYATLVSSYSGKDGEKPIVLAVKPSAVANAQVAFQHLPDALRAYEKQYTPYYFDRVGYVSVPFSGGAMEHATNIAYPENAIDAGTDRETLMAHELSHHWWGDLVTCRTAAHMWLNEGWASYSESLFMEEVYGRKAYVDYVRANHYSVLRYAHLVDDGYRPIVPIPHAYVYGQHVYNKGADVAHTLRAYLGDSLFFAGVHAFLEANKFKDISTEDLRDFLAGHSGKNLNDFFDKWLYKPGFPHFEIENYRLEQSGSNYIVKDLYVGQRLKAAPELYKEVPLQLVAISKDWQIEKKTITSSGLDKTDWKLPFRPEMIAINWEGQVSDAITREYQVIKETGSYTFDECLLNIKAEEVTDSALVYVEHHWLGPIYNRVPADTRISTERFWTVGGIFPEGLKLSASLVYDGRTPLSPYVGYLDTALITETEDSLVLLYKAHPADAWQEYAAYTKNMGNKTDKVGNIVITELKKGYYTLAVKDETASVEPVTDEKNEMALVYPNPASNVLQIKVAEGYKLRSISLTDAAGREVYRNDTSGMAGQVSVPVQGYKPGVYILGLTDSKGRKWNKQIVIRHY